MDQYGRHPGGAATTAATDADAVAAAAAAAASADGAGDGPCLSAADAALLLAAASVGRGGGSPGEGGAKANGRGAGGGASSVAGRVDHGGRPVLPGGGGPAGGPAGAAASASRHGRPVNGTADGVASVRGGGGGGGSTGGGRPGTRPVSASRHNVAVLPWMRRLAYDEFTSSAPTTGVTPGASASGAPGGGGGRAKADGGSAGGGDPAAAADGDGGTPTERRVAEIDDQFAAAARARANWPALRHPHPHKGRLTAVHVAPVLPHFGAAGVAVRSVEFTDASPATELRPEAGGGSAAAAGGGGGGGSDAGGRDVERRLGQAVLSRDARTGAYILHVPDDPDAGAAAAADRDASDGEAADGSEPTRLRAVRAYDPKGLTRGAVGRKPTGDEPAPQTLLVVRGAVRVAAYVPVWARRTLTRRPKAVDEGGRWPGIRLTRKRRRAGGEGGVDAAVNALLEPDLSAAADLDAVRMLEDD